MMHAASLEDLHGHVESFEKNWENSNGAFEEIHRSPMLLLSLEIGWRKMGLRWRV